MASAIRRSLPDRGCWRGPTFISWNSSYTKAPFPRRNAGLAQRYSQANKNLLHAGHWRLVVALVCYLSDLHRSAQFTVVLISQSQLLVSQTMA